MSGKRKRTLGVFGLLALVAITGFVITFGVTGNSANQVLNDAGSSLNEMGYAADPEMTNEDAKLSNSMTSAPDDTTTAKDGRSYIREAQVTVQFPRHKLNKRATEVDSLVEKYDGFIQNSSSSTNEGESTASLTVEVPASNYAKFVKALGETGTVTDRNFAATDDTQRHDQARSTFKTQAIQVSSLQAQVDALHAKGRPVPQALNDELTQAKVYLAELRASLDRVQKAEHRITVTISMNEKPVSQIQKSWAMSWNVVAGIVGLMMVGLAALIPIALLLLAIVGAWKLGSRIKRTPSIAVE